MAAVRLRIVVMGTTAFAAPCLRRLLALGHEIVALYTQPPRPAGRGRQLRRTPLHEVADGLGLPVRTPLTLRDPVAQADLAAMQADVAVVGAYGLLLPQPILDAPRLGCLNLHASMLPRWRGAAPIERAILAGDQATGLSIFQMERGLDTGPVHVAEAVPIGPRTTAPELHETLATIAAELLPPVIQRLAAGEGAPVPQPTEGVTYAHKIASDEGRLDFDQPAIVADRKVRALNPRPGCWCEVRGERLMVLEAEPVAGAGRPGEIVALPLTVATAAGGLRLTRVQRAGRKPMAAEELQRGFALPPGTLLG